MSIPVGHQKSKLVSVEVPWKVAPSTPFLRAYASEFKDAEALFVAYFGPLGEQGSQNNERYSANKSIRVVSPPYPSSEETNLESAEYQLIKVIFEGSTWVRMSPAFSDLEVIDESTYDWSAVKLRYQRGQDIDRWLNLFFEEWKRSSLCPDPGMYEVKASPWLYETGAIHRGYKHYLIVGEDAYLEVIAKDWKYEYAGAVENW